ncbi:RsfA family transcriptional regulator [Alicyclobacillus sp. SO9]|uniref:RsfA family transcriptional regulator n=1 Tax=Alicyclobacillus sp. SO9 TaxID=2665646 RepID=UPI001E441BA9|nr:RsfA family transcriptional regulator [Alicyclobacillus sp. SO9]
MGQTLKTMRQDAWTIEDDQILAEIVLNHIRNGSTQLAGFNESSRKLGRTAAACGFRWNACVRKQYRNSIEGAKEKRKERKSEQIEAQLEGGDPDHPTATLMSWAQVLRFLRQEKSTAQHWASRWRQAERQASHLQESYDALKQAYEEVKTEHEQLLRDHETVVADYRALVQIVDRARKSAVFDNDEMQSGFMYRIDEHGNLERVASDSLSAES